MKILNKLVHFGIPVIGLIIISACGSSRPALIPEAVNTVNTVTFRDLNLRNGDYQLLNRATADATVQVYYKSKKEMVISCPDDDFSVTYVGGVGAWTLKESTGVAKFGYLANDDVNMSKGFYSAENIVRRIAIYRLINLVQQQGADGIIEPTVSTNVAQSNKKTIIFNTHAEGKMIRLNSSK